MAIQNKPRPVEQRPAQRQAITKPSTKVSAGIVKATKDIFTGKPAPKVVHRADAKFVEGRPESPLNQIINPNTGASAQRFAFDHVGFLDGFLSRPAKVRRPA